MNQIDFDTIKILTTSYCNLNCKHCYQYYDKNKYMLAANKLVELVDFAIINNTRTIDLGGGEFFAHPFAYELLSYCIQKKMNVNIATNATSIDLGFFKKISNSNLLTIQISIDGLKATHDFRRGNGAFDKAIANAYALHSIGIPLTASMALDEKNYMDAIHVLELAPFSNFIFTPVAYAGAASINNELRRCSDYEDTICYLMRNTSSASTSFAEQIFPHTLAIKYTGEVFISPIAADFDLFSIGNINTQSISDILEGFIKSEKFDFFTRINSSMIDECNDCEKQSVCGRGCRFRAYKLFGDFLKPDPFCCRVYLNKYDNIPISKLFWGETL